MRLKQQGITLQQAYDAAHAPMAPPATTMPPPAGAQPLEAHAPTSGASANSHDHWNGNEHEIDRYVAMLVHLPGADHTKDWQDTIAACAAYAPTSPRLQEAVDTWSKGGTLYWTERGKPMTAIVPGCPEKYNAADQRNAWMRFAERATSGVAARPVRINTLVHWAQKNGWHGRRQPFGLGGIVRSELSPSPEGLLVALQVVVVFVQPASPLQL